MDSTVVCNKQHCRKEGLGRFHSNDYTRGFYGFFFKETICFTWYSNRERPSLVKLFTKKTLWTSPFSRAPVKRCVIHLWCPVRKSNFSLDFLVDNNWYFLNVTKLKQNSLKFCDLALLYNMLSSKRTKSNV